MRLVGKPFALLALCLSSVSPARGQAPDAIYVARIPPLQMPGHEGWTVPSRLGAEVQMPPASLIEQLDLPKGQGLVLGEVKPDSAAAKGGLKSYDVLLEIDGKPVPRDLSALSKSLAAFKEDAKVTLVVLRKGKNETIKELALTKAQEGREGFPPLGFRPPDGLLAPPPLPIMPPPVEVLPPQLPVLPLGGEFFPPQPGGRGVMTTIFRTGERFTARHQEGSLIITLVGENGKVKEIKVQDGRENGSYESADKAPAAYRDKARNLTEMIEKSNAKIEIKEK